MAAAMSVGCGHFKTGNMVNNLSAVPLYMCIYKRVKAWIITLYSPPCLILILSCGFCQMTVKIMKGDLQISLGKLGNGNGNHVEVILELDLALADSYDYLFNMVKYCSTDFNL